MNIKFGIILKGFSLGFIVLSLQACTKVEDYFLGKDNTPTPTALTAIKPKLKMVQNWAYPVGSIEKNQEFLNLQPVIADGIIYTASQKGEVKALNRHTHAELWRTELRQTLNSGPAISADVLAVTGETRLLVLSKTTGKLLWKQGLSSEVLSKPAISQNKLVVKTIDGKLYAFELDTGKALWRVNHGSPDFIVKGSSSPVIKDNVVYVGYSDGKFEAVSLNNGQVLWQRSVSYAQGSSDVERLVDLDSDPIIVGDTAYLASYQGHVGALSLTDGRFLWNRPASVYKNIRYGRGRLFMTDNNDVIWALNANNGEVLWKQGAFKARGLTEPVLMDDKLIVGDKEGVLHALSTQNGELLGRAELSSAIYSTPTVDSKHLYVQTANGMLNQLNIG